MLRIVHSTSGDRGAAHVAIPQDGHAASKLAFLDEAVPGDLSRQHMGGFHGHIKLIKHLWGISMGKIGISMGIWLVPARHGGSPFHDAKTMENPTILGDEN